MKAVLSILAWLYLVAGLLSLSLPIAVLSSAISGEWNALSLFLMLPALFLGIGSIWLSVTYLREKEKNAAESMATLTGIAVWLVLNASLIDFVEPFDEKYGTLAGFGIVISPIIMGVITTKLMKASINRTYHKQYEPDGLGNA